MKTLTAVVDDDYVQTLDFVIRSSKLYSSRSEFIKDAVREKMEALVRLSEELRDIREASKRLASKAKARGWNGSIPSKSEREKNANQFLKEKGFK
ncbi:MAG: ribbon-helix-helix domain-containing protein [Candidatus Diapherotrites archaeon]